VRSWESQAGSPPGPGDEQGLSVSEASRVGWKHNTYHSSAGMGSSIEQARSTALLRARGCHETSDGSCVSMATMTAF
jgi:hypothetical protein